MNREMIEAFLVEQGGWVASRTICERFGLNERELRAKGREAGLLDGFAVSSTRQGEHGFCHHRYVSREEFIRAKHRLKRHALAEIRKVRLWEHGRQRCLATPAPAQDPDGQLVMFAGGVA